MWNDLFPVNLNLKHQFLNNNRRLESFMNFLSFLYTFCRKCAKSFRKTLKRSKSKKSENLRQSVIHNSNV